METLGVGVLINVPWPVQCKVELQQVRNKLQTISTRVEYRGNKDKVVAALRASIKEVKNTLKELDKAFGS